MNKEWQERTEQLIGQEGIMHLKGKKVLVAGIGGEGGSCVEALARSGIGTIGIIDKDIIEPSNLNRQIFATEDTLGMSKVKAAEERLAKINPQAKIQSYDCFYQDLSEREKLISGYDYVVDAIDDIKGKIALIKDSFNMKIPIVSAMGMGNRMNPLMLYEADIYETQYCPLAKSVRKGLRDLGILSLKVVYSKEECIKMHPPGTMAFVPNSCGLALASIVVRDLLKEIL